MSEKLETKDVLAAMYRGEIEPEKATAILATRMNPVELAEALVDAFSRGGIRPLFCDEDGLPHGRDQMLPVVDPALELNAFQQAALKAYVELDANGRWRPEVQALADFPGTESAFRVAVGGCRDPVMVWLLDELAAERGCDDRDVAVARLESIQGVVLGVLNAIDSLDEESSDRQGVRPS